MVKQHDNDDVDDNKDNDEVTDDDDYVMMMTRYNENVSDNNDGIDNLIYSITIIMLLLTFSLILSSLF